MNFIRRVPSGGVEIGGNMIVDGWTSERPKEEGFYWFYGRAGMFHNAVPHLTIARFAHYIHNGLMCYIAGYPFYEHETRGLWKKIEDPDISLALTTVLNELNDAVKFCHAEALKGS